MAQKRLLLKLPRENSKTFQKHFTRKEAHNLGPCTDLIVTRDLKLRGRLLKLAYQYMVSLITVLDNSPSYFLVQCDLLYLLLINR